MPSNYPHIPHCLPIPGLLYGPQHVFSIFVTVKKLVVLKTYYSSKLYSCTTRVCACGTCGTVLLYTYMYIHTYIHVHTYMYTCIPQLLVLHMLVYSVFTRNPRTTCMQQRTPPYHVLLEEPNCS